MARTPSRPIDFVGNGVSRAPVRTAGFPSQPSGDEAGGLPLVGRPPSHHTHFARQRVGLVALMHVTGEELGCGVYEGQLGRQTSLARTDAAYIGGVEIERTGKLCVMHVRDVHEEVNLASDPTKLCCFAAMHKTPFLATMV